MQKINWRWYRWNELTQNDLYSLLRLRQQVFIVEQRCIFSDADGLDPYCRHLIGWHDDTQEAVAALRIVPALIKFTEVSVGRIVTSASVRREGVGKQLLAQALSFLDTAGTPVTKMSAQSYLLPFYSGFGYESIGEIYLDDGIEHQDMVRWLPATAVNGPSDASTRLSYEPLTANHASELLSALADLRIYEYMDENPYPNSTALAARYAILERGAPAGAGQLWLNWAVRETHTNRAIGTVQATLYPAALGDIGYAFDSAVWGQGFGSEAVQWLANTLMQRYGMQNLRGQVDSRNLASCKVLERCGFVRQATVSAQLREVATVDHVYGFSG